MNSCQAQSHCRAAQVLTAVGRGGARGASWCPVWWGGKASGCQLPVMLLKICEALSMEAVELSRFSVCSVLSVHFGCRFAADVAD